MKRFVPIIVLVALTSCAGGKTLSPVTQLSNHPLIGSLMRSFGITADQAVGTSGAVLALGQNRMPATEWTKLASAIPDVSDIIKAGSAVGGIAGAPNSLADLANPFANLGLSQQQVSILIPAVVDYVSRAAGPEVGGALASVLK